MKMIRGIITVMTFVSLSIMANTCAYATRDSNPLGHEARNNNATVHIMAQQTSKPNNILARTHVYNLKNKLRLVVREDHRAPIVVSQIWYKVGSAQEPGGFTGISHVLEHMMFKGTKKYPAGKFSQIIAQNGGNENAFTSHDFTVYFQKMPKEKLAISFALEADRMQHLNFSKADFAKELEVVKEERRMRTEDNPQNLTYERFLATAHIAAPYHHPVIGWMNDLRHLSTKNVRDWYKKWYRPNNAVIIVVGDVKPRAVYRLAKKYFGSIPAKQTPKLKPQSEPPSLGQRLVNVSAPAKLPELMLGYNVPSAKNAEINWEPYALEVLVGLLDGGKSARLTKNLIRKHHIATEVGASYDLFSYFPGLVTINATPAPGHSIAKLQHALLKEIEKLRTKLIPPKELERIKNQVLAQKVYSKDSLFRQAQEIGSLEAINLPWQLADEYVDNILAVTGEQIESVAHKYLNPHRLTIATLHPLLINGKAKKTANTGTSKEAQYVH